MFDITVYSGKLLAGAGDGGWQSLRTLPLMLMLILLTGSRAWGDGDIPLANRWVQVQKNQRGSWLCGHTHTHEAASPLGDKLNG